MSNQVWTKTTSGNVLDTLGNIVGTGNGAGVITLTAAQVQVTNGNTLRIEDGVTIKMLISGSTERFLVTRNATGSGTLTIVGTETAPVKITSSALGPAPGDYSECIEMSNSVQASNPTVTADWCIFEYAITGIFSSSSQPTTVTLRHCTFRRIQQSYVQTTGGQRFGANGLWRLEHCVFDKCAQDTPGTSGNDLIICSGTAPSGGGTAMRMEIDHCSILYNDDDATNDKEVFQAGPQGQMDVRNSIFQGTNVHPVRTLTNADTVATNGVLTNDWNWYQTDGLQDWVNGAHDQSKDAEFLDDSCVGNGDLRPNFATGVSTADEFGALLGALEPYGVPAPLPPPDEAPCSSTYAGFSSAACAPFVCDYDFFTGEYPEDWRRELYDRKEVQPHQLIVCIQIPNRGIPLDFEFAPGVPIPVVGSDDESVTVDLGCWVQSMRPIRAERDVTFREYQGSDIDLVIMDWFGRLDPHINPSLFTNIRWQGLRVDVGSWIHGTQTVLRHGRYFLDDITRRGDTTVLRLRDWFIETLQQPLRANTITLGSPTFKSSNKGVGFDLAFVVVHSDIATIETVRLIMQDEGSTNSRSFRYIGSITGDQGLGSLDADFTTADGSVTIQQIQYGAGAWHGSLYPQGVFAPKDEVLFGLGNVADGTPVLIAYQYLTSWGPLFPGIDIDPTEFGMAERLLPSMAPVLLRHDKAITLLEACRIVAAHGFLTLSTNAEGHVVLGGFKPTLALDLSLIQDVAICSSNDLKELETSNLPIYNVIRAAYNPLKADGIAHSGLVGGTATRWSSYPTDDLGPDFNRSAIFWDAEYPFNLELPGFRAGQEAAIFAILQNYWIFFEGTPTAREQLVATTKLHNLNRDLEDIVRLESRFPERAIWGQVIGYGKAPLSQEIELTVVDVSDIVQPDFACGYAFCDVGHRCDDCWVCW